MLNLVTTAAFGKKSGTDYKGLLINELQLENTMKYNYKHLIQLVLFWDVCFSKRVEFHIV